MTRTQTLISCNTHRRRFYGAFSLVLSLFGLYVYFVGASVVHVVASKEIRREAAGLDSRIGTAEAAYLRAGEAIAPAGLPALGFVSAPPRTLYIVKAPKNVALAHDEN